MPIPRRTLLTALTLAPLPLRAAPKLRAVTSFSILADLTRLVAADRLTLTNLVPPEADVHEFEPTPGHAKTLAQADILISNGLGLEPWLPRLAKAAGFKGRAVLTSTGIPPRRLENATDPHVWQNVAYAKKALTTIAEALAAADPDNAPAYRQSATQSAARFDQLDAEIRAAFAPIPPAQRIIVTTHDAFGYYGAAYNITFLAPLGLSTEAEPSAKALGALAKQIKTRHVRALFLEKRGNSALIQQLAQETGTRIGGEVYSDALSLPTGPAPTYETMMRHNLAAFTAALA